MANDSMAPKLSRIILYSKPGCHLCDIARSVIDDIVAQPEYQGTFTIDEVNIQLDPVVFARYRYRIPVIQLDDKIIAEGNIDTDNIPDIVAALRQIQPH